MDADDYEDGSHAPAGPPWAVPDQVDGAWGRTANPNTADGELQNIAAFGAGLSRLTGPRRRVVQVLVWAILVGFVFTAVLAAISHL